MGVGVDTEREGEGERQNLKTLLYKNCSFDSVKQLVLAKLLTKINTRHHL